MGMPKRRKLERVSETSAPVSSQKFYCCRCGLSYSRQKGYFPVSHSPMYRGSGYLPICNDCVEDLYEYYCTKLGDHRSAMKRMCMKLDLYWNDSIYDMVEKTAGVNSRVRNYIGKTNIVRYIDKTYDNTIEEELSEHGAISTDRDMTAETAVDGNASTEAQSEDHSEADMPVDQQVIDFWGRGYSNSFYRELDRRYANWTQGKQITAPEELSLYRQICVLETVIARDSAAGKAIDKNVNALNSLLGSLNLKPAQKKSDADADIDNMPLGVGIQNWEFSRPLPEMPKESADQSGIIRNITTWFLGHACKMVGLKNSYCKMYEDAMERLRVDRPEYADEDDDALLSDIFENPAIDAASVDTSGGEQPDE